MRELPVEHCAHPLGADDQVPVAKIPVYQPRHTRFVRRAIAQPPKCGLEYRAAAAEGSITLVKLVKLAARKLLFQLREGRHRNRMDASENRATLEAQL